MELKDYLSALRRRKWVIVVATLGVMATAVVLSKLETPVYEARARLSIEPAQPVFTGTRAVLSGPAFLETQMLVIESKPVKDRVREKLGVAPAVSTTQVGTTSVVEVSAQSTKSRQAAAIANAYIDAYLSVRGKQETDTLGAQASELQAKVDGLQKQIDNLAGQLAGLGNCSAPNPPDPCARRDSLQHDRDALVTQQSPFKQRLDQLDVDRSGEGTVAQVLTPASAPSRPVRPTPVRNGLLGLGIGLILGVIGALMFEYFDESIKGKDELESFTPSLPVLGLIPTTPGWKDSGACHLISLEDPNSPSAEAYRSLRTSIRFLAVDKPLRTIQVTSPNAAEGKTTTIANLAVALAKAGERVVVVSGDLRRPRVHEFFGLMNTIGLTSVLLGECSLSSALQKVNDTDQLWFLGSGPLPPNPSELLTSTRVTETLSSLTGFADIVLIDCPPVLPVTDSAIISSRVDGTLLVATAGTTTRKQLVRAVELLRQVGAPLVGSILNNAPSEGGYSYVYHRYEGRLDPKSSKTNGAQPAGGGAGPRVLKPANEQPGSGPKAAARRVD